MYSEIINGCSPVVSNKPNDWYIWLCCVGKKKKVFVGISRLIYVMWILFGVAASLHY